MLIDRPGIYRGVLEPDYRADPCSTPSLTQSLCKILIERAPKHAWICHPRLNPNFEPDNDPKFDVGNAAHKLILGRGKDFGIIDAPDWRTKAAKEARELAAENGKIGILQHQFEQASSMVKDAWDQLRGHEDRDAFSGGDAEVMICWEENGIWFRALLDLSQVEFAAIAGVAQPTVSKWEAGVLHPNRDEMARIRAAAAERGLEWQDSWFFETPQEAT